MSKFTKVLAIAALCGMITTAAFAGTSTYYFTGTEYQPGNAVGFVGNTYINGSDNYVSSPNLATANNPTVYVQPKIHAGANTTAHVLAGVDTSQTDLQLWSHVVDTAITTEIMGSLGVDVVASDAVHTNTLTMYTTGANVGFANPAWDGTNIVTPPMTDARAVVVPDSIADFGVTGLIPNSPATNSYRVARVHVQAPCGLNFRPATTTTYKMAVGNVLIARVDSPAEAAAGAESVNFGWNGAGVPDAAQGGPGACAVAGSGSCVGATTATADATVICAYKGDFNNDGTVSSADNLAFTTAKGAVLANTATTLQKFLGDFNIDGTASSADNLGFTTQKGFFLAGLSCP